LPVDIVPFNCVVLELLTVAVRFARMATPFASVAETVPAMLVSVTSRF